jgi:hypothetical protein
MIQTERGACEFCPVSECRSDFEDTAARRLSPRAIFSGSSRTIGLVSVVRGIREAQRKRNVQARSR